MEVRDLGLKLEKLSGKRARVDRATHKQSSRNSPKDHLTTDLVQVAAQDCDPGE